MTSNFELPRGVSKAHVSQSEILARGLYTSSFERKRDFCRAFCQKKNEIEIFKEKVTCNLSQRIFFYFLVQTFSFKFPKTFDLIYTFNIFWKKASLTHSNRHSLSGYPKFAFRSREPFYLPLLRRNVSFLDSIAFPVELRIRT